MVRVRVGVWVRVHFISMKQGRSERGSRGRRLSLIEKFTKDDTTPLTTPKRGKNDVEMP